MILHIPEDPAPHSDTLDQQNTLTGKTNIGDLPPRCAKIGVDDFFHLPSWHRHSSLLINIGSDAQKDINWEISLKKDNIKPPVSTLRIFVLGLSGGLGQAMLDHFSNQNIEVWGSFNQHQINVNGVKPVKIEFFQINLLERESILKGIKAIASATGGVQFDALICNAGSSILGNQLGTDDDAYEQSFAINFLGVRHFIKYFIPLLKPQAKIMILSTSLSLAHLPWIGSYALSKMTLNHFAKILSLELKLEPATEKIRVTVIALGSFKTKIWDTGLGHLKNIKTIPPLLLNLIFKSSEKSGDPELFAKKMYQWVKQKKLSPWIIWGPDSYLLVFLSFVPGSFISLFIKLIKKMKPD